MDILYLPERVKNIIALGESHFREFKTGFSGAIDFKEKRDPKSIAKDIGETLVGFANADGGDLLIGVEDNGTITGLSHSSNTIDQLLDAYKNNVYKETPLYNVLAKRIDIEGKTILLFSVDKSTRYIHLTSDGRCLQRSDKETIPVAVEQLRFERQEQISREYDRQFVDGAELTDLDTNLIGRIGQLISPGLSIEKFLQMLGVAEFSKGMQLRRAALLLFAKEIYRWHPRSEVRILRIKGLELKTGRDYNVISDESARGNITELLGEAWEKLRPHLVETKFSSDALFKQRIMYPEDACREALTNALAHRDYSIEGRGIEIKIFDDRMEITSPGALLSNLTVNDLTKLTGAHQSRNSFIARVLKEIGYMREMGEGIRRIFSLMKLNDLVQPEVHSDETTFNISLHSKSVFTEDDQRFLKGFEFLNLTREESLIALLGKNHEYLSPQQIYDHLELVDWDEYRKIIDQVQVKGLLFNARTEEEKKKLARNKNISQREVKRLKIRTPKECEEGIKDLTDGLKKMGFTPKIFQTYLISLNSLLPKTSIYHDNNSPVFLKRLRFLNLIDNSNEPTSLLFAIWGITKKDFDKKPKETKHVVDEKQNGPKSVNNKPVQTLNEDVINEKVIASEVTPIHTLFLEGLDYNSTKKDLFELFEQSANIKEISIPLNYYGKRGRGFAYITVASTEFGELLIQNYNNTTFRDRIIRLQWSKK